MKITSLSRKIRKALPLRYCGAVIVAAGTASGSIISCADCRGNTLDGSAGGSAPFGCDDGILPLSDRK